MDVPAQAVRGGHNGAPKVLVANGGKAVSRDVKVGLRGTGKVEIVEGLSGGEQVILDAAIAAGTRVRGRVMAQDFIAPAKAGGK